MTIKYPTIALTGATGFLGSHLMAALLKQGHRVIVLGRSSGEATLKQRMASLLKWFGIEALSDRLGLVEIDFTQARLGLELSIYLSIYLYIYNTLCIKAGQLIHCASDTSFSEHRRQQVFESNVLSLNHILNYANDARVQYFHYISTA